MKTGISMQGKVEKTNSANKIKCDCKNCFHTYKKSDFYYCEFYDLINPNKTKCKKFLYQKFQKPLSPKLAKQKLSR